MNIKVNQTQQEPEYKFEVVIEENGDSATPTSTRHFVSMSKDFYDRLDTDKEPWEVVRESFVFLLSKEPKEMILPEFDIVIIGRYFPDFNEHTL